MSEKVGEIYYDVGADIAPLLQGSTQAKAALDSMGKGADKASGNMDGLERSAQKTGKAVARSANDASQASKVMESLGNQVAILEEKQQNGAISNRDLGGAGGGGSTIQQEVHFHIQTTNGIDDATMNKMAGMMKQVALYQMKDQSTRPGGMLQPRK